MGDCMPRKIDFRHKDIGSIHRARSRYAMLLNRVRNTHRKRNECYKGVKVLVGRDEFIEWFMENDYEGCSVDRIDRHGDYELSNMQLIPSWANCGKDKLRIVDRKKECRSCKEYKPFDEMVKCSRNALTGLDNICKRCEAKRTKARDANPTEEQLIRRRAACRRSYYKRKELNRISSGV